MKRRYGFRATRFVAGGALLATLAVGGCAFENPLEEVSEEDFDEFQDDVADLLRELFPDLSEEEIAEISGTISYEDVLALSAEIDKVRAVAEELSSALFVDASAAAEEREENLAEANGGFPEGLAAVGRTCLYDESSGQAEVLLSGIFNGQTAVLLDESASVTVSVDGAVQTGELSCLATGESVDIVFLIDITGSMSNVIASVRNSVVRFVDAIEASGVAGTISVVTFQDTVGVNTTFQQLEPAGGIERSPFFKPVPIDDVDGVDDVRSFINRLEANSGADAPENLAGAIDFARNNVIGGTMSSPNVIDGAGDPPSTKPFVELESERQVFVALTDSTFHSDDRSASNSSLLESFVPRNAADILSTLHQSRTVVHVIDPSWVDRTLSPTSAPDVDSDYWAIHTGGLGEDVVLGYSLVDLELVIVAEETGLLDVALDGIIASSCTYRFNADLSGQAEVELQIEAEGQVFTELVGVVSH